jgi:AcrR family transcriptional regulator
MKPTVRMSSDDRRRGIIRAVRRVFVEKGFHGTTTRELARAAGVSEALLFKHFPSKEALYAAIQLSCFSEERPKIVERLRTLEPSASTLVLLVHGLVSHMLAGRTPDEDERSFVRLVLRSLMEEGDFARLGLQHGPTHWVRKVEECLRAAMAEGEIVEGPVRPESVGWFVNQMAAMIMIHLLPAKPVIDFGVPRESLIEQVVWFALRGMGLKEEAIRRLYDPKTLGSLAD